MGAQASAGSMMSTQVQPPSASGGKGGAMTSSPPNMFQNAANATNMGMSGAAAEMGYQANPVTAGMYNAATMNPFMVNPSALGGVGGSSANAQMLDADTGQFSAAQMNQADIDRFMNPYIQNVVDTAAGDIRSFSDQQQNQVAAQAQAAGAFGGSRGALMESEVLKNAASQLADTSGNLRMQGFNTALTNAQQDVARRQQANMGSAANRLAALQGNQQAGLQASITNANTSTQRGIASAGNQLQALLANQGSANLAGQLNMGALNAASQFNLGNQFAADTFNENSRLSASGQRLGAGAQLASIGNQGFNQANTVLGNQQQSGLQQQGLNQAVIDAAKGQWQGFAGQPAEALGYLSQALGATQIPQSQTTSRQPGLFDYLTLAFSG